MVNKMQMEHKEIYELIDAYVFGILSQDEFEAVEKHLESKCTDCLQRLREVGELSVGLAKGLKETTPPAHLKTSLMEAVEKTMISTESVTPKNNMFQSKIITVLGTAAIILLVLWNGSLNFKVSELHSQLENSIKKLDRLVADNSVQNEATLLLGKPCTKLVDLQGVSPNLQASAKMFLHPDEDFGILYAYQLPVAPADKEYQVWLKQDGIMQSVGSFTVQENGSALIEVRGLQKIPTIDSFMVTIEPVGGVDSPTGMTYLLGQNTLSSLH